MGQVLPLPRRIPNPNAEQKLQLKEMGIETEQECDDTASGDPPKKDYVTYTLPAGWKMVNNSWREDLPDFFIIDENKMKRVSIRGSWKETYDNDIRLCILKGKDIELFVPRNKPALPSETTAVALMGKALDTIGSDRALSLVIPVTQPLGDNCDSSDSSDDNCSDNDAN